jgi:protein-S-isoprenylcysteine O-methyltransferase Ste14
MYLGLTSISLGVAFWTGWWPMFLAPVVTFATANWVHIPFEEEKMRRQFADVFDAYARKVRRWL